MALALCVAQAAHLSLRAERLIIQQVDYEPYLRPGFHGMPSLNLSAIDYKQHIPKTHTVIVMESDAVKVTLLPNMGRVFSIFDKSTGHDVLWRNDVAWPGGANNKLGWWLWIGGIEYTIPGEEHGYTWALPWNWSVAENSTTRIAIDAIVVEPSTMLRERLTFSLAAGSAALRTDVKVTNPTAHATSFAHWTNVPLVPGGTNELLDDTIFDIPADRINISKRWQHDLGPSPQPWPASPLHGIRGWLAMGDFTVQGGVKHGYYGAYVPSLDEGALRLFDISATPGLDTWTYGFHPAPHAVPMGSGAYSKGYAEMWGGNVKTFPNERAPIASGEEIGWAEWIVPYHGLGGPCHPADGIVGEHACQQSQQPQQQQEQPRPRPPPKRPRIDVQTGTFRLPDGREATFHGACVTESSTEQQVAGLVHLTDEKLDWFKTHGLNTLRVGVHWSLLEIAPLVYNETYLDEIVALIGRLARHEIWAIVDMHQDQWSTYYCSGHGVPTFYAAPPEDQPQYHPGGAKAYPLPVAPSTLTNATPPPSEQMDCAEFMRKHQGSAASLYTYALGAATQRMYDDAKLQAAFGAFWSKVATALRPLANIVAFELINEPWYGDVKLERGPGGVDGWRLGQPAALSAPSLMRLYTSLHEAIRAVDDETIVLFEPGAGGAAYHEPTNFTSGPGGSSYDDRQAFSYHQYCPDSLDGHEWGGAPPPSSPADVAARIKRCDDATAAMVAMRRQDAKAVCAGRGGGAALVTEFGQVNNDTVGVAALTAATSAYEAASQGWTIWSVQLMNWLQTGGVPGRHVKPAPPPANWLKPLARTYAAAVPGDVLSQQFDPETGAYTLRYTAAEDPATRRMPCVIRLSAALHYPNGRIGRSASPEGKVQWHDRSAHGESELVLVHEPMASGGLRAREEVIVRVWRL